MNILLILWHQLLLSWDEEELHDRSVDNSSSTLWAARVMETNEWRRREIKRLQSKSWVHQLWCQS